MPQHSAGAQCRCPRDAAATQAVVNAPPPQTQLLFRFTQHSCASPTPGMSVVGTRIARKRSVPTGQPAATSL